MTDTPLRWIEGRDLATSFHGEPFPPRPHRGLLGPLTRSMRDLGCICPILARPRGDRLQVVCGFRRLLAAQAAGIPALPVLVRDLTDEECWRFFADENCRREDLGRRRVLYRAEDQIEAPLPLAQAVGAPPAAAGGDSVEVAAKVEGPAAPAGAPPAAPPEKDHDLPLVLLSRRAEACFRGIAGTRVIPVEEVEGIAGELIALAPVRNGRNLRAFAMAGSGEWMAAHALTVAALGIHLAEALDWTPGQVKKFTLACLLHDVGMLFIPKQCLLSRGPLTASQRALVERHPEIGREIIQGSRAWGAQIHLVAQDHHERWDGSGYPGRKKEKEVDLPARIVGFLDCFAALTSERPHRPALLYSQASRFMSEATAVGLHDPAILARFRGVFTDLPLGSCLRLPDGRIGRVVGADPRNPWRHRVRILSEAGAPAGEPPIWIDSAGPHATEISHPGAHATPAPGGGPARAAVIEALNSSPALEPLVPSELG